MAELSATPPRRRFLLECSGACGDLGTFIPHVIGAITVAGLAPAGILFGFAAFLIATGLFYGLPLPVQPMKAISAVILTGGLRPGEVAAAGIMIGVVLLVLGITGWIGRLARAIPQSVSAGLQLGLGLLMGVLGLKLILENPWLGFGSLALLFALTRVPRCPAAVGARRRHRRRMGDGQCQHRIGGRHHAGHAAPGRAELGGNLAQL
jgi:hypothetical protein